MSLTFSGPVPVPSPQSTPLSILITGASRGIGYTLVRQYAEAHPQNIVLAGVRDPSSQQIQHYASQHKNVHIIHLDVNDVKNIQQSVSSVRLFTDHIDVLINNAGTMGEGDPKIVTQQEMIRVFQTSVIGPLSVTQSYLPLLHASTVGAKVIQVSSSLGSNQYANALGMPFISYGTSKAALNYVNTVLKSSFPDITFLSIHPGWVDTDMGNEAGSTPPTKPQDSAQAIRYYIQNKSKANSGEYLDTMTGNQIPY